MMRKLSSLGLFAAFVVFFAGPVAAQQQPAIVAHRGLLKHAPENTLPAFRACLELQLGFEMDVRRAADGTLVCVHDDTVDRTTDGHGQVAQLTVPQLKQLDAGSWFDRRFAAARVPTIDEIFALVASYPASGSLVAVDMKGADERIEADVIAAAQKHGVLPRLLFIGRTINHPEVRQRLLAANRDAAVAVLAQTPKDLPAALADEGARWAYLRFVPTAAQAQAVKAAGKKIFIAGATVAGPPSQNNVDANWRSATAAGVDAILTDYPLELAEQLREQQAQP